MHPMCTRSKKGSSPPDDIDEYGNISNLIDYDCDEYFDQEELNKELLKLRKGKNKKKKIIIEELDKEELKSPIKHKKKSKNEVNGLLGDVIMNYILKRANEKIQKKKFSKRKKNKVIIIKDVELEGNNEMSDNEMSDIEISEEDSDIELSEDELTEKTTTTEDDEYMELSDEEEEEYEEELSDIEVSEEESDLDELDDEYNELIEEYAIDNTEDGNLDYFHNLSKEKKEKYIEEIKNVYSLSSSHIPLKFKVLNSDMDLYTKSIAINNLDKLAEMDISTGEYNKMDQWINGLIKLPFGKMVELPVTNEDSFDKKREYIQQTLNNMDKAIYGHKEAKTHILQVIGKWIRNTDSLGNVLAIQGPMGNGKTTLIKDGIAKSLNRPFEFVALGGASDSSFFEGHSYTYEGSRWGRIVDILHKCGSMNPIICFDELDKVSETAKGDEIINMLIHMTDPSQNTKFQDNYFPGIDIDLSKVLFIFSFNDESKINRILKDRMYVIRTKGYKINDKLQIAHNYLLPDILHIFNYKKEEIIFTDEILIDIIKYYTSNEEGVRNLKRCLENIISTLNIYHLTKSDKKDDIIDMKIKNFKLPITLTKENIKDLLTINNSDNPPEHMYL